MKSHYEIVPAKKYYGRHATGSVLLRNGHPEYHAPTKDVRKAYNDAIRRYS